MEMTHIVKSTVSWVMATIVVAIAVWTVIVFGTDLGQQCSDQKCYTQLDKRLAVFETKTESTISAKTSDRFRRAEFNAEKVLLLAYIDRGDAVLRQELQAARRECTARIDAVYRERK